MQSCPVLPTIVLDSSDSLSLSFQSWEDIGFLGHPGILRSCPSHTTAHAVRRIPWCPLRHRPLSRPLTSRDPPLVTPQTQAPILSRGSLGHPRIPPVMSPQTQAPILSGGSLGHPGIPPVMSPQTQAPMLSGGFLGHPGILPWCPLRQRPRTVQRFP